MQLLFYIQQFTSITVNYITVVNGDFIILNHLSLLSVSINPSSLVDPNMTNSVKDRKIET